MNYSIIGSGNVGSALAKHFARSGIAVGLANTRGPSSIASMAKEIGNAVIPMTLPEALKAEVVILAIPFRAHTTVAGGLPSWSGKVVVDAMNTYGISPEELKGRPSTELVATAFSGAKVVKTLNQLPAKLLAKDPADGGGRRVMFVSSNDDDAQTAISKLVAALGFAPILLGKLDEGGNLIGMGGPLILQNLIKQG